MTTMASDSGTLSCSQRDDDHSTQHVDGSDTILSSSSDNGPDNVDSDTSDSLRSSTSDDEEQPAATVAMTARAYQLEMLEESLKQNIIVAMDTGSGKTQVAILRIQAELEQSEKIAWFLAPTVSLAEQQFEAIRAQIPGVQSKLILGSDNVAAWSTKHGVWDAVLMNTRIVVSTYQILRDAVSHALIPLSSLGLVVVDEAHNCTKMNPVARLMREHYAPTKAKGLPVPHILGLTASPLMRSNLDDLEVLEQTLDAVVKTPSRHREELFAQVNRPEMKTLSYGGIADPRDSVYPLTAIARLKKVYLELNIKQDPYVRHLLADNSPRSRNKLKTALLTRKTNTMSQMESLCNRACEMCDSLGPWAADYYVYRVISGFLKDAGAQIEPNNSLRDQERKYLAEAFRKVGVQPPSHTPTALSPKVQALLDALESYQGNPIGIVFVKERATVAVLSHILAVHPKTAHRYRVGSMVGTSTVPGRRQDFLDLSQKEYLLSLQAFRRGKTNLLVATSVLEEGIDVPACNLVICFDKPDNLKSFIQRRGRARMAASQLYLLVEDDSDPSSRGWQDLEREMKRKYEDDMRENEQLEKLEDDGDLEYPVLRDGETGAQLTIHDAKPHLEHFCATLRARKFVDWSPFYVVHDLEGNAVDAHQPGLRKATVHLPVSLAPELRCFESLYAWPSEASACKDAAFQAYAKLYEVGLVNGHLLPLSEADVLRDVEPRAAVATVRARFNPWLRVASAWRDGGEMFRRGVTVSSPDGSQRVELEVALPVPVPDIGSFDLYWDYGAPWVVSMDPQDEAVTGAADHTSALLALAFGHRWRMEDKHHPVRFSCLDRELSLENLSVDPISPELMESVASTRLVRDIANQTPYFYVRWLPTKPPAELVGKADLGFDEAPPGTPYVVVKSWPKKVGLYRRHIHPTPMPSTKLYPRALPASQLRVDSIPAIYAHVGQLIPAITHALEVHLVAKDLLETRLEKTGITDLSLVVAAISTRNARGSTDYERIEFLGDSILKFCTTINCCAKHLKYPEGFLSPLKDRIVSNSRLFRAAVDFGLDRYIVHEPFTLHKWRPNYVEDLLDNPPSATETRKLSTKILADVIEALIGAAYLSGGTPNALTCMSLFLPDFEWQSIELGREILYHEAPADDALPVTMRPLEQLLGYTFTRKSLLVEAMTHGSCNGPGIRASLDRLEFLGDAILDHVVVNKLFAMSSTASSRPLETERLHLLRTALVNADIVGFLVMEWVVVQKRVDVTTTTTTTPDSPPEEVRGEITTTPTTHPLPLISFLRHFSPDLAQTQRATSIRHARMRAQILQGLWHGKHYPWSLLCGLQILKFYSDVFEAVLGAVWVDSGSLIECEKVVERVGILPLLRRLVSDGVWLLHPKEELGRLVGGEKVDFEVEYSNCDGEGEGGEGKFGCRVLVGGECLGVVEGCGSRLEARTRAAEEACRVLRGRRERIERGEKERMVSGDEQRERGGVCVDVDVDVV